MKKVRCIGPDPTNSCILPPASCLSPTIRIYLSDAGCVCMDVSFLFQHLAMACQLNPPHHYCHPFWSHPFSPPTSYQIPSHLISSHHITLHRSCFSLLPPPPPPSSPVPPPRTSRPPPPPAPPIPPLNLSVPVPAPVPVRLIDLP